MGGDCQDKQVCRSCMIVHSRHEMYQIQHLSFPINRLSINRCYKEEDYHGYFLEKIEKIDQEWQDIVQFTISTCPILILKNKLSSIAKTFNQLQDESLKTRQLLQLEHVQRDKLQQCVQQIRFLKKKRFQCHPKRLKAHIQAKSQKVLKYMKKAAENWKKTLIKLNEYVQNLDLLPPVQTQDTQLYVQPQNLDDQLQIDQVQGIQESNWQKAEEIHGGDLQSIAQININGPLTENLRQVSLKSQKTLEKTANVYAEVGESIQPQKTEALPKPILKVQRTKTEDSIKATQSSGNHQKTSRANIQAEARKAAKLQKEQQMMKTGLTNQEDKKTPAQKSEERGFREAKYENWRPSV